MQICFSSTYKPWKASSFLKWFSERCFFVSAKLQKYFSCVNMKEITYWDSQSQKKIHHQVPDQFGKKNSILELTLCHHKYSSEIHTWGKKKTIFKSYGVTGLQYEAYMVRNKILSKLNRKRKVSSETLKWEGEECKTCPIVIMGQDFKACCAWAKHLQQQHCMSGTSKIRYNFHRKIKQQLTLLVQNSNSRCLLMQEICTWWHN